MLHIVCNRVPVILSLDPRPGSVIARWWIISRTGKAHELIGRLPPSPFYRQILGELAGLVDVSADGYGGVIREELDGNCVEYRRDEGNKLWQLHILPG